MVDSKIYIIGGKSLVVPDTLEPEKSIEVLDMQTGAIASAGKMPDARSEFGCAYVNGLIYVIGGKYITRRDRRESFTNRVDNFNPSTGRWEAGSNLPDPSTANVSVVDGSLIVAAGGFAGDRTLKSVLTFNPMTSTWASLPPLCRPTSAHSTVFLGKYIFLFGDYDHPGEILAYNLRDKTSSVFTLQYDAARHAAAVANAKKVFVIGGKPYRTAVPLDKIQVFQLTHSGAETPKK